MRSQWPLSRDVIRAQPGSLRFTRFLFISSPLLPFPSDLFSFQTSRGQGLGWGWGGGWKGVGGGAVSGRWRWGGGREGGREKFDNWLNLFDADLSPKTYLVTGEGPRSQEVGVGVGGGGGGLGW